MLVSRSILTRRIASVAASVALVGGVTGAILAAPAAASPALPPAPANTSEVVSVSGTVDATCGTVPGSPTVFTSIQAAVDAASPGDTIYVCAGAFSGAVSVTTADLTIDGAQYGINAQTRTPSASTESVITPGAPAVNAVSVGADDLTISGFTIQDEAPGTDTLSSGGFGIVQSAANSGAQITDNIIQNLTAGIYLNSDGANQTVVEDNLIAGNAEAGAADGDGIYTDGGLSNVLITDNTVTTTPAEVDVAAGIVVASETEAQSDVTISDNQFSGSTSLVLVNLSDSTVDNNFVDGTGTGGNDAIGIYGGDSGIAVLGNQIEGSTAAAVDIDSLVVPTLNSGITVDDNSIDATNAVGLAVAPASYPTDHIVTATDDWWGCAGGPGAVGSTTCGSVDNQTPATVTVTSTPYLKDVSVTPGPETVGAGSSVKLTATLQDNDGNAVSPPLTGLGISFSTDPTATTNGSQAEAVLGAVGTATFTFSEDAVKAVVATAEIMFASPLPEASTLKATSTVTFTAPTISATSRTGEGDVTISGQAVDGATVSLYATPYGATTVAYVGATTASSTGAYSFTERIQRTTEYAVSVDGVDSAAATATMTDRVYEYLTRPAHGTVQVRVVTNPPVSGVDVSFDQVGAKGKLTVLKTEEITASDGVVIHTFTVKASTITVESKVAAGDGTVGGTSPAHTVSITH